MRTYGITGKKYHGKDTLARFVQQCDTSFNITHFAAALKGMAAEVFGLDDYDVNDPIGKECTLPLPFVMDEYIEHMSQATGLQIQPRGLVAHTPRQVLQFFGTDYVRSVAPTYWLDLLAADVRNLRDRGLGALVPDTRFLNEAELIRTLGGKVIKVVRIDLKDHGDAHASEAEIDLIQPDLLLGIRTGDTSLALRVAQLIGLGLWDVACEHDYRGVPEALQLSAQGSRDAVCRGHLGATRGREVSQLTFNILRSYYMRPARVAS